MLFKQIDPRQYAALRMAFGFLGLMTLLGLVGDSTFYYSDEGFLPLSLVLKLTEKREWTLLHAVTSPWAIKVFFYAEMLAAVGMIVGYRARVCTWLLWLGIVSLHSRNWLNTYGGDAVLRMMLFYLGFAPTGAAWSIDSLLRRYREGARLANHRDPSVVAFSERRREPERAFIWPLRLMQIQICLVYFTTGMAKLRGVGWFEGTALTMVLANPTFIRFDYSILDNSKIVGWLCRLATQLTFWWEISFSLLVLQRHTRWVALALGVCMHMGIILFLQIHWFGYIMIATYLAFLPNALFARAAQWLRVQLRKHTALTRVRVVFDDGHTIGRRAALAITLMDVLRRVTLIPRSQRERWEALACGLRDHHMRAAFCTVRRGQRVEPGFDGLLRLGTRVPLVWPLRMLCKIQVVKQRLGRAYAEWMAQQPRHVGPDATPRSRLRSVS
jgi:hypothetical protein